MKGVTKAWNTKDQQSLPPDARRKSWKPIPNLGPGLSIDPRALKSRRRACLASAGLIRETVLDRAEGRKLWRKLLWITRVYWADKKYDTQPTFGDIKKELSIFGRQLAVSLEAFSKLSKEARREVNDDRTLRSDDNARLDHISIAQAILEKLEKANKHVCLPDYVRVKSVAVKNCCDELERVWEALTGRHFRRTGDNEVGPAGIGFVSPGPRFIQDVMGAIDPDIGFEQVHSWLKKPKQAENRNR